MKYRVMVTTENGEVLVKSEGAVPLEHLPSEALAVMEEAMCAAQTRGEQASTLLRFERRARKKAEAERDTLRAALEDTKRNK